MNLSRYGTFGGLLLIGCPTISLGTSGMVQDPARVRLLGPLCSQLESTAIRFDEQGRLTIDLSSMPSLTADRPKTICLIKIPFKATPQPMAGTWQMEADYHATSNSRMLSTVRFSSVGTVGEVHTWQPTSDSAKDTLLWSEKFSIPQEGDEEQELKIVWTSELKTAVKEPVEPGKEIEPACIPEFKFKQIVIAPPIDPVENPL